MDDAALARVSGAGVSAGGAFVGAAGAAPLVVTADPAVWTRVSRAAAAAQVRVDQVMTVPSAGAWLRAPAVLLDAALLPELLAADLPRRDGIVVLAPAAGPEEALPDAIWQAALAVGAQRVAAGDDADRVLVQVLGEAGLHAPGGVAPGSLIAVISACGGAGGSIFAAALALTAARARQTVVLADLDPGGAGLDITLGAEEFGGARWGDIDAADGRIPADALLRALPSVRSGRGAVSLLCRGREAVSAVAEIAAVGAVLDSTRRAGALTVVDLPRHLPASADRVLARADLTVLLATAEVRGAVGAGRLAPLLAAAGGQLGLVVRGPSPGGVGAADMAAAVGVPLLAAMRPVPSLATSIDAGRGLGPRLAKPLRQAAERVLAAAGEQR